MHDTPAEAGGPTARPSAIISVAPLILPSPGRGAALHVRVSAPLVGEALPVVVFSHGNGQSLHGYGPLVDHWAAHGFAVVQPMHLDARVLGLPPDDPRRPHFWRHREEDLVAYYLSPAPKALCTAFGGEHALGGIPGYEARETTDERPGRIAAIRLLSTAFLRSALYPGDPAWDEAAALLTGEPAPEGRIETK